MAIRSRWRSIASPGHRWPGCDRHRCRSIEAASCRGVAVPASRPGQPRAGCDPVHQSGRSGQRVEGVAVRSLGPVVNVIGTGGDPVAVSLDRFTWAAAVGSDHHQRQGFEASQWSTCPGRSARSSRPGVRSAPMAMWSRSAPVAIASRVGSFASPGRRPSVPIITSGKGSRLRGWIIPAGHRVEVVGLHHRHPWRRDCLRPVSRFVSSLDRLTRTISGRWEAVSCRGVAVVNVSRAFGSIIAARWRRVAAPAVMCSRWWSIASPGDCCPVVRRSIKAVAGPVVIRSRAAGSIARAYGVCIVTRGDPFAVSLHRITWALLARRHRHRWRFIEAASVRGVAVPASRYVGNLGPVVIGSIKSGPVVNVSRALGSIAWACRVVIGTRAAGSVDPIHQQRERLPVSRFPLVTRSTLPGNVRPSVPIITSGNGSRALGVVSQLGGVAVFVVIGSAQTWRRGFQIHRSGKRSRRRGSIIAARWRVEGVRLQRDR